MRVESVVWITERRDVLSGVFAIACMIAYVQYARGDSTGNRWWYAASLVLFALAVALLRRRGVPVAVSRDAGRYLCNAGYYRALAEPCPVLFVHVPPPRTKRPVRPGRRPDASREERALADLVLLLARLGRA